MSEEKKSCPLTNAATEKGDSPFYCEGAKCQWWTSAYTKGGKIFDCAIVILAKKNSEGQIPI